MPRLGPGREAGVSARSVVFRIATLLLVGATLGGIIGAIFTGDWIYTIIWCAGLTLALIVIPVFLNRATRRRGITAPGRIPGIISSQTAQPAPTKAVLNPPSTAIPSTGAILNGVPVDEPSRPAFGHTRTGRARWWNRALAIATVVVGIALTLIPSYRLIGWTVGNIAQGRWDGNDMRIGLHQQDAVDDLAGVIGSYDFVSVSFYDSYVIIEAPTFPGATTTDQYEWQYARATRVGPYSGVIDGLFDGSRVDFSIIDDLVAQAKADTGWHDFTYYYPSVREFDGVVEINIALGTTTTQPAIPSRLQDNCSTGTARDWTEDAAAGRVRTEYECLGAHSSRAV